LTDNDFAGRVRDALDREVRGILAETGADWRGMQHRRLAERLKSLVAAWRTLSTPPPSPSPPHHQALDPTAPAGLPFPAGDPAELPSLAEDPGGLPVLAGDAAGSPSLAEDPAVLPFLAGDAAGLPVLAGDAAGLLRLAEHLVGLLRERQNPSGLFRGGDNVDSPPDTAFSVNDLADAAQLLRDADDPAARSLAGTLRQLLAGTTPALVNGGVHTPNHRWELSAALARLHRLEPRAVLAERVEQWLAEGIDIEDGLYSERSANYAAHVSNPSLLLIAEVFDRPDLLAAVEQNLTATLDLLLPDGTVETVLSRRQDQRGRIPLRAFLLPLRATAVLRGRGDLAWAAGIALEQGIDSPGSAAAALLLHPVVGRALPPPEPPARPRLRHFRAAATVVAHGVAAAPDPAPTTPSPAGSLVETRGPVASAARVPGQAVTTVVFGGSDYSRHRRIRSGLANSPTFLRVHAGAAVLDSVRLSRTFFGVGPFRAEGLVLEPGPVAVLRESVTAAYYQPLKPGDRDDGGRYHLGDDGRFSAAMSFSRRASDEVTLTTVIRVTLGPTDRPPGREVPAVPEVPAGAHRCLTPAETAVEPSHDGPAVPHRCLGPAETAVEPNEDPAVPHRCLGPAETAVEPSHEDPAVPHRCLGPAETAVEPSHEGSAVPYRCLSDAETAVSPSHEDRGHEDRGQVGRGRDGRGWGGRGPGESVGLEVEVAGAAVDWALELAFRPGGVLTGASPLEDGRWLLESGTAVYRVGGDELRVTVAEAPQVASESGPGYHPGEDYEFLGGTDAAEGVRLYVTGKAPSMLSLRIDSSIN
jgi:hypothetical protein